MNGNEANLPALAMDEKVQHAPHVCKCPSAEAAPAPPGGCRDSGGTRRGPHVLSHQESVAVRSRDERVHSAASACLPLRNFSSELWRCHRRPRGVHRSREPQRKLTIYLLQNLE
jgi:hypothetical protein